MTKPVYRAASTERTTSASRGQVFDAAVSTLGETEVILTSEPPWRLVTVTSDAAADLHETTVAIVDGPAGTTLFSVSVVIGPETEPGALDEHLSAVLGELDGRASTIEAALP